MRLIDADALIRKFKTASPMAIDGRARQMVEEMPTIEERKTGRWIKEHIDITDKEHPKSFRFHRCSACNHVAAPALFVDEEKLLSYCPHCGAYMGGEQDEAD